MQTQADRRGGPLVDPPPCCLGWAMVDGDEVALQDTVRGHIERLRANVLARLESAGALLRGPLY